jgi:hypothetical protein
MHSKLGLALPATFLILLVSTLGIVAFTYYYSVERINTQGQTLKVSTAKQNLLSFDEAIVSTLWQPGSSSTYSLRDSGGKICIQPHNNTLTVTVSDDSTINCTLFNATVGRVIYELPSSRSADIGFYPKGDSRSIVNQSGASISQLCIANGAAHPELQLRYRPSVTYAVTGEENGKTVNTIRIYIVNLNSSVNVALYGEIPFQISCVSTQLSTQDYPVSYSSGNFALTCSLDGAASAVTVPISGTAEGAIIHVETVLCNLSIQRWLR